MPLIPVSDDNSSIQSSPWQRDQPWKQSRPRRGISKELSLYYRRPRHSVLGKAALQTAIRKRRRPHEPLAASEEPIFESAAKTESGDETLKADAAEAAEGGASGEASANEIKTEESESIKAEKEGPLPVKEVKEEVQEKAESEAVPPTAEPAKDETVEKMNTSEDDEVTAGAKPLNGDLNGDIKAKHGKAHLANLAPKPRARAKLSGIIQKLIDGVPARLEQMSKTPMTPAPATATGAADRSGGGTSLNHSLPHKVTNISSHSYFLQLTLCSPIRFRRPRLQQQPVAWWSTITSMCRPANASCASSRRYRWRIMDARTMAVEAVAAAAEQVASEVAPRHRHRHLPASRRQ